MALWLCADDQAPCPPRTQGWAGFGTPLERNLWFRVLGDPWPSHGARGDPSFAARPPRRASASRAACYPNPRIGLHTAEPNVKAKRMHAPACDPNRGFDYT